VPHNNLRLNSKFRKFKFEAIQILFDTLYLRAYSLPRSRHSAKRFREKLNQLKAGIEKDPGDGVALPSFFSRHTPAIESACLSLKSNTDES
jgi:hypothetical protein